MASNRITYNIGFTTDTSGLSKAKKALQEIQNMTTADVSGLNFSNARQELEDIQHSAKQLEGALDNAFNAKLGTVNLQRLNSELNKLDLNTISNNMSKLGAQGQAAFRNIATQALTAKAEVKQTNVLLTKMKDTLGRTLSWSLSSAVINRFVGGIQQAIGYVKNLDTSLNNIRIVTGASADEMERFAERANDAARSMGAATTDYTNAALIYYQQGLGEEEVEARTDVTIKTANVTQQSAEQVSEHLTAVWNGYKVSAEEAELYVDKLSAVAATTAADLGELSTGMSKVASAASTMGVDADQLNAQLATIISVTRQAPESVGTALKTIYARMGDLQVEGGTDEFGVSLGDVSGTLKEAGIEVLDVNGNLRDMGSVIEEVGSKWDTWTEAQKNAISIAIAGKRQYNNLFALFENWDMYTDTLNVSKNSMGALQEQQDIYMESTEAHLQQMRTAAEGLYDSMLDENAIITLADVGKELLVFFENWTDSLGGGLSILNMALPILIRIFSGEIAAGLQKFVSNLGVGARNARELAAEQEIIAKFGTQTANDKALQNLINIKKQFLQYDKVLSKEEKERVSEIIKQTNELQNQKAVYQEMIDKANQFTQREYGGKNVDQLIQDDEQPDLQSRVKAATKIQQSGGVGGEAFPASATEAYYQSLGNVTRATKELVNVNEELNSKNLKAQELYRETRAGVETQLKQKNLQIELLKEERNLLDPTSKEYEDLTKKIKEYGEEVTELEEKKQKIIKTANKETAEYKNQKEIYQSLKIALEETGRTFIEYRDRQNATQKGAKAVTDALKNQYQELQKNKDVIGQTKFDELTQEYKELLHVLNSGNPADIFNSNGQFFTNLENFRIHTNQAFDDVANNGGIAVRVLREDIPSAMMRATESANALDQSTNAFLNEAKWRSIAKGAIDAFGAIGQLASGIQSFNNISNIWKNEDLTISEKWVQTLSNAAFILPMLGTAVKKLGDSLGITSLVQSKIIASTDAFTVAIKKATLAQNVEKLQVDKILGSQELLDAAKKSRILSEEQYTLALQIQQGQIDKNNLTEAQQATLTSTRTALTQANTIATNTNTAAQEGLNAAMAANPVGWIIAGFALIITVITKVISAQKEALEETRKLREERIEDSKAIIEENESLLKLLSTYKEVNDRYKEGAATKEEMADVTQTLIDQYEDLDNVYIKELARVAELTGNYDKLTEAIKEEQKAKLEESLTEAKSLEVDTKAATLDSENKINIPHLDSFEVESLERLQKLPDYLADKNSKVDREFIREKYGYEIIGKNVHISTLEGAKNLIADINEELDILSEQGIVGTDYTNSLRKIKEEVEADATAWEEATQAAIEYGIALENLDFTFSKINNLESFYTTEDEWIKKQDEAGNLEGKSLQEKKALFRDFVTQSSETAAEYAYQASYIDELEGYIQKSYELPGGGSKMGLERQEQLAKDLGTIIYDKDLADVINEDSIFGNVDLMEELRNAAIKDGAEYGENYINAINEAIRAGLDPTGLYQYAEASIDSADQIIQGVKDKSISGEDLANNESWKLLSDQFSALGTIYSDLQNDIEILQATEYAGTEQWLFALEQVEEKWRAINEDRLNASKREAFEKLDNKNIDGIQLDMNVVLNDEEALDSLQQIMDADYQITIQATVKAKDELSGLVEDMKKAQDLAGKIGENFVITAGDVKELASEFPGIMEGATYLSDGTIKLNEAVVKSSVYATQVIIQNKIKEVEAEYNTAKEALDIQINRYTTIAKLATELAALEEDNSEGAADKRAALENALRDELQKSYETTANNQSEAASAATAETAKAYTTDLTNYTSIEKAKTETKAHYIGLRMELEEAAVNNDMAAYHRYVNEIKKDFSVDPVIQTVDIVSEIDVDFEKNQVELLKEGEGNADEIADYANTIVEALLKERNELDAQYQESIAYLNSLTATNSNIGKTTSDAAESTKDLADSTKDAADAASKLVDILNEEIDAYHDINIAITQLETSLSRLQDQQFKLTGNELISNLNAQLDILEKQKTAYAEKLKIAQMEANVNRILLTKEGATFNDDGTINNYSDLLLAKQAYVNKVIEKYNKMSAEEQEGYEATLEAAKEEYEKVKEAIEKYDSLITEEIPGLQDSIQSAFNQQIEIQIEAFKLKVDLTLSTNEAEREWNTFVDKVINNISEEDTLGNALTKKLNLDTYYNMDREGSIQALTSQLNDTLYEINQIQTLGFSSVFGDNIAAAEEYAEELRKQLMTALEEEKALVDEIKAAYLEMINQANEGLKEQTEQYEYISELIEHDKALIELLYGDKAYNKMSHYYTLQNENNKAQLAFYKQQADLWKERMNREEEGTEAWKKYKENWQESVSSMNDMLETSIQGIIDEYTNTINIIFEQLGDKVTGGAGLESVKEEWELINDAAEDYLDDINAAYEIQKFQNTLQQAIDNTDSLDAQQTLTNLMNEQLSILEKKDKITQYDLDRANALYDVEVKRIALQEAQQNKSKMRLRRDSQGNYSYQFVSDEDQVAQAAQELAEAQNSLYNLDKDAYKNNLDQIQEIYSEWSEKLQEIISDTTLSYEEKQAEMVRLTQYYGDRLQNVAEQNASIRLNLEESVFQALADMYDTNVETFYNMSQEEKDILMSDMVPGWNDGIQEMIDKIMAEGGLASASTEAFEEIEKATEDFNDQLEELEDIAEVSFDELSQGLDDCIEMNKDLLDSNEDLIDSWETQLSLIQDTIDSIALLTNVWNANKQAAIDAARAAWNYKKTQEIDVEGKGGSTGGGTSDNGGSSNGGNKGSNNGGGGGGNSSTNSDNGGSSSGLNTKKDDWGEDKYPAIGDKVTYLGDTYYSSSDGARPLGNRGAGENKEVAVTYLNPGAEYPVHVESTDAAYGWLKKYQIAKMDTGGYTGDWNSVEGKVAVLHEKELVLNKNDTSNILQAVRSIRAFAESNNRTPNTQIGIRDIFESIQDNLFSKVANMMTSLEMGGLGADFEKALSQINDQTVHQDVHIDATFPNVQSSSEIENALMNLTNVASQYSFNTRR